MGLDLTLGGLVLFLGIRGWLKGFIGQAIRLAGVISCVYLADPVRDLVMPRVIQYLPNIQPDVVRTIVWWSSAAISYVVLVGLTSLAIKMSKRKTLGDPEPNRNDQFGGFLLGVAKGVVLSALLLAGIEKYAIGRLKDLPWAETQAKTSRTLQWNERFQPVPKVWATPPVQHFVQHIQRMGLKTPAKGTEQEKEKETASPVAEGNHPPKLALPGDSRSPQEKASNAFESIEAMERALNIAPTDN